MKILAACLHSKLVGLRTLRKLQRSVVSFLKLDASEKQSESLTFSFRTRDIQNKGVDEQRRLQTPQKADILSSNLKIPIISSISAKKCRTRQDRTAVGSPGFRPGLEDVENEVRSSRRSVFSASSRWRVASDDPFRYSAPHVHCLSARA